MNPRVKNVKVLQNYTLLITFVNGEKKIFDVKPYLHLGLFKELNELNKFNSVVPFDGTIRWSNGLDFCPDTLYLDSQPET
jgi:hypothetical protein